MSIADTTHQSVDLLSEYAMTYDSIYLHYPNRYGYSKVFLFTEKMY